MNVILIIAAAVVASAVGSSRSRTGETSYGRASACRKSTVVCFNTARANRVLRVG